MSTVILLQVAFLLATLSCICLAYIHARRSGYIALFWIGCFFLLLVVKLWLIISG